MKYRVMENSALTGPRPCNGRPFTDKLAACMAAFMWKMNTGKECSVYDASTKCVYDTSINETEPAEIKHAILDGAFRDNPSLATGGL